MSAWLSAVCPTLTNGRQRNFVIRCLRFGHITDKMMCSYLKVLEKRFVEQGDIKERMHAARTGYRQAQDDLLERLKTENEQLKAEVQRLKAELEMRGLEE